MFIGLFVYCILLWGIGRKIPGRLKKHHIAEDYKSEKRKTRVILFYNIILAFLILLVFLMIQIITRGEL